MNESTQANVHIGKLEISPDCCNALFVSQVLLTTVVTVLHAHLLGFPVMVVVSMCFAVAVVRYAEIKSLRSRFRQSLVGARSLDVTWLLAAVADTLSGGLSGAFAAQMSNFAAVVALLALRTVARHVTKPPASVAGLSARAAAAVATTSATVATGMAAIATTTVGATLRA